MKNWFIFVFLFLGYTDVNSQIIIPDNFKIVQKPIV